MMTTHSESHADAAPPAPDDPSGSARPAWPLGLGILIAILHAVGVVFGGMGDYDLLFGFEAWRAAGLHFFLLAAAALLLLLSSRASATVAAFLSRSVRVIPGPLRTGLLVLALLVLFLTLPSVRTSGDAESILVQHGTGEVLATNPLTSWLHIGLSRLPGLDVREALRLLAALAGVAFVLAAVGIGRACFPDPARAAAVTAVVLTAGGVTLFFGTIEVYAPVFAAVGLYFLAGLRVCARVTTGFEGCCIPPRGVARVRQPEGVGSPSRLAGRAHQRSLSCEVTLAQTRRSPDRPWPALVLGVAVALHGSAVVLLPSLLYLANGMRLRPVRVRRVLTATGWFLLPPVLVVAGLFLVTPPGDAGTVAGGMGQGPILELTRTTGNLLHRYVMFGGEHLVGVVNVLFLASPVGLLLVLTGGLRRLDPVDRWLLSAAVCLFGLLFVWNLNYELRRDWELFAIAGLSLAVLGPRRALRHREGAAPAFGIAVLGLFCLLPLVIGNATGTRARIGHAMNVAAAFRTIASECEGTRAARARSTAERWEARGRELDRSGLGAMYARAGGFARRGDDRRAAAAYREMLGADPGNARALVGLGTVLYRSGRREEGTARLEEALRRDPLMLDVRLNLARIAVAVNEEERAIDLLTRGLILSGINPLADEALSMLAGLRRDRGEVEEAEVLLGLRRHAVD